MQSSSSLNQLGPQFVKYASVVLDASIDKTLDYGIPAEYADKAKPGMRVEVPLKGQLRQGYIIEIKDIPEFLPVQPLRQILSEDALICEELFILAKWMTTYYCASLRQVLKVILPSTLRKKLQHKQQLFVMRRKTRAELKEFCEKNRNKFPSQAAILDIMLKVKKGILLSSLLEKSKSSRSSVDSLAKKGYLLLDIVRVDRSPLINEEYIQTNPKHLHSDQQEALNRIKKSLEETRFETHLLYGVTGSGKTEVYLQAIDKALQMKKGIIMLVPEISLTAQTIERFRSRFEGKIAILHHRLSHGERYDEWHRIRRGDAQIVIGARSAIFSPVVNLGLIIVDEEHEHSYKQNEEAPCYHARDVAVMRGKLTQSSVILGSATPSLESFYNAQQKKYTLSILRSRADQASMPQIHVVDMKREYEKAQGYTNFSNLLLEGIKKRLKIGEQTLLFLNRRGYHTILICQQCNQTVKCHHCDVSLTFHLSEQSLSCHQCGFHLTPPPKQCCNCKGAHPMKFRGVGTELIEKSLQAIFPELRTLRIDADTTRHKGSHQKLLREFGTGKADVLIGTQMIAKGLHFPQVTLVGILNSDAGLNIPDFRASETAFQLMTQVAGRAGRGEIPGEVIIQTALPDNSTIQLASQQDYEKFYAEEMAIRNLFCYPPTISMVKISFTGSDQNKTAHYAETFRSLLIKKLSLQDQIHPVIPAGYAKVKDRYRFQFLIRGPKIYPISQALLDIKKQYSIPSGIKMLIDINPTSTFF